jgi:hypothetical protein
MRKRKAAAARSLERAMAGDLAGLTGPKPGAEGQEGEGQEEDEDVLPAGVGDGAGRAR